MEPPNIAGTYPSGFPAPARTATPTNISSNNDNDVAFACSICLEGVKDKDPVVTQCGHLYCWPCLYRWLHTRHGEGTCPVCKASVSQENVIPIFIRGSNSSDPRARAAAGVDFIPSRPQAHRPEPADLNNNTQNVAFNFGYNAQIGGISFASGYGFFPSLFGLQFQSFAPAPTAVAANDEEEEEQRKYLSRVLLCLGVTVILCLLFF
jgi:E3 ubiquitin-protein ligase RNF5